MKAVAIAHCKTVNEAHAPRITIEPSGPVMETKSIVESAIGIY